MSRRLPPSAASRLVDALVARYPRFGDGLPTVATANCDLSALCTRLGGDAMAQAICDRLRDYYHIKTHRILGRRKEDA